MSFERILATIDRCHVFRIGARPSAEGYKASNWHQNEIWCGRLKVLEKGKDCEIRLEDVETGKLYAVCKYKKGSVERVIDSGRYFVLRIEKGTRHAYFGIGFQERSESFTFKEALGEFEKYQDEGRVEREFKEIKTDDYTIKDGDVIKVKFKVKTKKKIVERKKKKEEKKKKKPGEEFNLEFAPPPKSTGGRRRRRRRRKQNDEEKKTESSSSNNNKSEDSKLIDF